MSNFQEHIQYFTTRMLALQRSSPFYFIVSTVFYEIAKESIEEFNSTHLKRKKTLDNKLYKEFSDLQSAYDDTGATMVMMPESFFVSLVSIYDYLISCCVRELCDIKPEILSASEKSLTYSQVLKFPDFDSLRKHCLEETAESVMRKSHIEHIDWLSSKANTTLKPTDTKWQMFVECTQRRHLFVHTGGYVSESYLANCKSNGVPIPDSHSIGHKLRVDAEYCEQAFSTLLTMGILITQVLWRKFCPSEIDQADGQLNDIAFTLIEYKKFEIAIELLEFAKNDVKKYSSEKVRLMLLVNLAQAYKWNKQKDKCQKLLGDLDPSGLPIEYRAVVYSLLEKYDEAISAITSAMKIKHIDRHDLEQWPVFKELRKSPEFADFYKKRYRRDWVKEEQDSSKTPFERLIPKLRERNQQKAKASKKKASKKKTISKKT